MIHVKITKELISKGLITGSIHKIKILEGLPKDCELRIVQFDGDILHLFFSEPPEEVKEAIITCERTE
jgi:hypothetical protein